MSENGTQVIFHTGMYNLKTAFNKCIRNQKPKNKTKSLQNKSTLSAVVVHNPHPRLQTNTISPQFQITVK